MFKNMKRLFVLAVVAVGLIAFAGAYQVVRTEGGYHFIRKKEFGFGSLMVDTRDWKLTDWVKNPDLGMALGDIKLEEMQDKASRSWDSFSKNVDKWVKDAGKHINTDSASKDLERLRKDAAKEYGKLAKKLENGKIDTKDFEKKMGELEDWFQGQMKKF